MVMDLDAVSLEAEVATADNLEGDAQIDAYISVLRREGDDDADIKAKETAMVKVAKLLSAASRRKELIALINDTRPFIVSVSKAKAAKLVRTLIDELMKIKGGRSKEDIDVIESCIEWAKGQNRTFLRQALQARLITIQIDLEDYGSSLTLTNVLLKELKKLDDKGLLVEVQLNESRIYHRIGNLSKARSALTSARMTANAIYVPPVLQAAMDMQSGILHAEETDYTTAYSYFFEAFEQYQSLASDETPMALKYMLLSKVMLGHSADVQQLVQAKASAYSGPDVDAMCEIAMAQKNRSLHELEEVLGKRADVLSGDVVVITHLNDLMDSTFAKNLLRLIEPFSVVEVAHVASLIDIPIKKVETKLSQMILDKELLGILDQGNGNLRLFPTKDNGSVHKGTLETMEHINTVVDALYRHAQQLG